LKKKTWGNRGRTTKGALRKDGKMGGVVDAECRRKKRHPEKKLKVQGGIEFHGQ